jgi:uncharacterized membrane protein HdeD (DUF308 family)
MTDAFGKTVDDQHSTESIRSKWGWFLLLGVVLMLCGTFAIVVPTVASVTGSVVLGIALTVVGIVKIVKAFQVKHGAGFIWQLLLGAVEVVGGILIYFNPMKRAIAITLLVALVLIAQGVTQAALALKLRAQPGWHWLLISGLIALSSSMILVLKFRYTRVYDPSTIAGISLLFAGCAYVAIALAIRKIRQ